MSCRMITKFKKTISHICTNGRQYLVFVGSGRNSVQIRCIIIAGTDVTN